MSEQAQTKALIAAEHASEAITALVNFGRHGGAIDSGRHYDMLYPLAAALQFALEAQGVVEGDDGQLYAAVIKWIRAG